MIVILDGYVLPDVDEILRWTESFRDQHQDDRVNVVGLITFSIEVIKMAFQYTSKKIIHFILLVNQAIS